jgi:hypothetical protein
MKKSNTTLLGNKKQSTYKGVSYRLNKNGGNIEIVINNRKWDDEGNPFMFESTFDDAIFSVRYIIDNHEYCDTDKFDSFYKQTKKNNLKN